MNSNADSTSRDVGDYLKPDPEKKVLHSNADSDLSDDECIQFNEDMHDVNDEIIHELLDDDDSAETSLSGR